MAKFQYAKAGGGLSDPFDAADATAAQSALKGFKDVAPTSGVIAYTGPTVSNVPGIGTLTVTPKNIQTTPIDKGGVGDNAAGLYARTGITPPAAPGSTPPAATGYTPPAVAGLPSYSSGVNSTTGVDSILKSYQDTLKQITDLEGKISSSAAASPEEQRLSKELATKKAQLKDFDLGTLQGSEALHGQGRGMTIANVGLQDAKLNRVRALSRLGLAQEADTLTDQLGLAQDQRKQQGEVATTMYNLATKRLDIALGIQDKITKIQDDEKDNARQYLLDVVNFADGKTYSQLDAETQAAITHAVANSPITLDMVQTALASGAEKAAAQKAGDLRTVSGLGVVQIMPNGSGGFTYKVVVPENPQPAPKNNAPTFEDYVTQQGIPYPALTQTKLAALRSEYDTKYGNSAVSLGKLTATNKTDLQQAGLISAPSAVQSYFLNTPPAFRDTYQRDYAAGKGGTPTLDAVISSYTKWYNAQNSGAHDWNAILGVPAK